MEGSVVRKRRICVVTTSRADFGLLCQLLHEIEEDSALQLQLLVSGAHTSRGPGNSMREIEQAGLRIAQKIPMRIAGEVALANLGAIAGGMKRFGTSFAALKPDLLVLLGDRFELFAPAIAALMLQVPIAHIHGGELTEGAMDEQVRHALTKMAALHFVATETYRRRVIQMGEHPRCVFNYGAPGLDALYRVPMPSREELEKSLGWSLQGPTALVTYHPAIREPISTRQQVRELIDALLCMEMPAIVTMANGDEDGAIINRALEALCRRFPRRFRWVPHLGHLRYLGCLRYCAVMIGNSSSGLIEAPSFKLPVVNIGGRQEGRVRAANVIDVPCNEIAISKAIRLATSKGFRSKLRGMRNPYDARKDGNVSRLIKNTLRDFPISDRIVRKKFWDLP